MSNAIQCHWGINNNAFILSCLIVGGVLGMGGVIWGAQVLPQTVKIKGVKIKWHCGIVEI